MTNSAFNVVNGTPAATGGVLYAPLKTAMPGTAVTAIPDGFTSGGYVSEDGLTKSESRDTNSIKDWSGLTVKKSQTGYEATFQFAFLEYLSEHGAKVIYGADAVVVTPATSSHGTQMRVAVKGKASPHLAWIFDMADGDAVIKILVPDGQVSETDDTVFGNSDAAGRGVTLTAFPDEDGVFFYELTDDGLKVGATTGS
ncbi:hypothetical protein E9228_002956 [Curtobacterium flaccumfaciens]|uniref:Phage tail protein n=1 Tax=Curtobacterium salicis TaxID=1779862 RepID=A0ABX0TDN9_9MICO|nr:hypothetical protein [Curtobacterium sp. WW7]NII42298.1 hypothetical protein [Curtobacterium sp. WW7]